MPERFAIVGLDLKPMSDDDFRAHLRSGVDEFSRCERPDDESWRLFSEHLAYRQADFGAPDSYRMLAGLLEDRCSRWDRDAFIIYYLATPPALLPPTDYIRLVFDAPLHVEQPDALGGMQLVRGQG